ncbi:MULTISPECIES: TerC family protein [Pseudomonas]|uniref:TerC family protein n=1 Tax=Pseudomonas taiwanensis TaxID=470150 RepID=A0ABR6V5N4_9PSED|nr:MULTISPECIES: TerC family protein [Pseudomonas]MBC3475813.1 TerC family protein [Pseudomonas taiwanensis]BDM22289.1 TerC family protein [Pseudomonas sp. LRP2-20]
MLEIFNSFSWAALAQIVAIDILLGGDNAVVIALACRNLPADLRKRAITAGVAGAILLRIALLFFAIQILALPALKIVGGLMLLWIGIKLFQAEQEDTGEIAGGTKLISAIKTIIIADAVMSLDNVLALAGAAGGDLLLVSLGVLISIPIIVWGSRLVLALMDRFPQIIALGAALLGWIAGGMIAADALVAKHLSTIPITPTTMHYASAAIGAVLVLALGYLISRKRALPARS